MTITIHKADYNNLSDGEAIKTILNHYACDPMGGGKEIDGTILDSVVEKLSKFPTAISYIASDGTKAVGLINAFENFSTFKGKPLINIHDIAVLEDYRGKGIGRMLLQAIEDEAVKRGCCKLTLEVLEGNQTAQYLYRSFGFNGYELHPDMGQAKFWEKEL